MYDKLIKRFFDLLVGIIALPLLGLATLVIAPLIKREDKGPVFYNAPRIGRDRKPFIMYKFRTMCENAPDLKMPDGSTYNAPDDPRMTRIGARLRRSSLDELPQILNIIRGEMSFIGPRPETPELTRLYTEKIPFYPYRYAILPGITGWAQVNYGYASVTSENRIKLSYDLYYVKHASFLLDTLIVLKTIKTILVGFGSK